MKISRQIKKFRKRKALALVCLLSVIGLGSEAVAQVDLPGVVFEEASLISPDYALDSFYSGEFSPTAKPLTEMDNRILDLAEALRDDPNLIYRHIHNNYVVEPRFGLAKGSLGALLDRSGTPFDLTNLAVDLFRSAGFNAEYQLGAISLSATEFGLWFGIVENLDEASQSFSVDAQYACQFLANGGIPAKVNGSDSCAAVAGDLLDTVEMLHIWAKVYVNGSWVIFDPNLKSHKLYAGVDLGTAMGGTCALSDAATTDVYDIATDTSLGFQSGTKWIAGLNVTEIADSLRQCSVAFESHILAEHPQDSFEQVFGGRDITEIVEATASQLTHPNVVSQAGVLSWNGEVPYKFRTKFTVTLDRNFSPVMTYSAYGEELYGKVMALHIGDNTAPYGTDNIFRLILNGNIETTVSRQEGDYDIVLKIDHPYAAASAISAVEGTYVDRTVRRDLTVPYIMSNVFPNTTYNIVFGMGLSGPGLLHTLDEYTGLTRITGEGLTLQSPASDWLDYDLREQVYVSHTNAIAVYSFLNNTSYSSKLTERVNDVSIQHHHSLGIMSIGEHSFLDIDSGFSVSNSNVAADPKIPVAHSLTALMSGFEAQALSRPYTYNATSSMPLLAYSSSDIIGGKTIYEIDSSNWGVIRDAFEGVLLGADFEANELINDYIQSGYTVYTYDGYQTLYTVPVDNIPDSANDEEGGPPPDPLRLGFVAVSPDSSKIAHIVGTRKGFVTGVDNFAGLQQSLLAKKDASMDQDYWGVKQIDIASGKMSISVTDIVAGSGPFPYSLPFTRTYLSHSNRSALQHDFGGEWCLNYGLCKTSWTHNYKIEGFYMRDTAMALGKRRALDAVDAIVALYNVRKILDGGTGLARLMASFQSTNWLMEDMTINAASIKVGPREIRFSEPSSLAGGSHLTVNKVTNSMVAGQVFYGPQASQDTLTLKSTTTGYSLLGRTYANAKYALPDGTIYSIPLLANTGSVDGVVVDPNLNYTIEYPPVQISFTTGMEVDVSLQDYWPATTSLNKVGYRSYNITNSVGRRLTINDLGVVTDSGNSVSYTFQPSLHPVNLASYSKLKSFTDSEGHTTTYIYDSGGSMLLKSVANALSDVVLNVEYDSHDRMTTLTDAQSNTWNYYVSGDFSAVIDPLDAESRNFIDSKGRRVRTIGPLGAINTYDFGSAGLLIKQTFPGQNYVEFEYDDRHNVVKKTAFSKPDPNNPSAPRETISIDAEFAAISYQNLSADHIVDINTLVWWTDANGGRTDLTYYPNGQIHMVKGPCLDGTASCADAGRPITTYTYTSLGLIDTITDPVGMINKNTYDNSGDLSSEIVDFGGQDLKTVFFYDSSGRVCREVDPRGSAGLTGGIDPACDQ